MKKILFVILSLFLAKNINAQRDVSGAPQQASNLMNPNISVVTHFLSSVGNDQTLDQKVFTLDEAELGIQAIVDPYSRADAFISFSPEGVALEEAYFTWLTMPAGLQARFGKFRSNWNGLNLTHPGETPFADIPLSTQNFLGPEGLSAIGTSLSWLVPINLFYLKWTAEITNLPEESPTFGEIDTSGILVQSQRKQDLAYLSRFSSYFDLSESANLSWGLTYLGGVHDPNGQLWSHLGNFELVLRWKNPRRAIYSSLIWRNEIVMNNRELTPGSFIRSWGGFSHLDWQFSRRLHIGGRYDYSQFTDDNKAFEQGGLAYVSLSPSEFSLVTLQGRYVKRADKKNDWAGFLKLSFNIGPHGAHQF